MNKLQYTAPDLYQHLRCHPDDWAAVVQAQIDTSQNPTRPAWLIEMLQGSDGREALSAALAVLGKLLAGSAVPADIRPYFRLSDQVAPASVTGSAEDLGPGSTATEDGGSLEIPQGLRLNAGQERRIRSLIRQAEEYLRPQPLEESNAKIQKMVETIKLSGDEVKMMLESRDARLRVPAYVMLQKRSGNADTALLAECLGPETRYVEETGESRPLYQLLAAVAARSVYLRNVSQKNLLLSGLRSCLERLEASSSLDSQGQCKDYCRKLIQRLE
jgi:hypothetical protein